MFVINCVFQEPVFCSKYYIMYRLLLCIVGGEHGFKHFLVFLLLCYFRFSVKPCFLFVQVHNIFMAVCCCCLFVCLFVRWVLFVVCCTLCVFCLFSIPVCSLICFHCCLFSVVCLHGRVLCFLDMRSPSRIIFA